MSQSAGEVQGNPPDRVVLTAKDELTLRHLGLKLMKNSPQKKTIKESMRCIFFLRFSFVLNVCIN